MHTEAIEMDRAEAERLWRKYREHRAWQKPIDAEIERIYRLIAKGKLVIRALDSIAAAGVGDDRLPQLAIIRADLPVCFLRMHPNGSARFAGDEWVTGRTARDRYFEFPTGTFPNAKTGHFKAVTPHIPPDIRPARGLANYHILFEPDWTFAPPVDPMLIRRVGKGDTWLVVGAWDLTEVERAAMKARIRP
jgi:hypothetical protein